MLELDDEEPVQELLETVELVVVVLLGDVVAVVVGVGVVVVDVLDVVVQELDVEVLLLELLDFELVVGCAAGRRCRCGR